MGLSSPLRLSRRSLLLPQAGNTALHLASEEGIELLLASGASVDKVNKARFSLDVFQT